MRIKERAELALDLIDVRIGMSEAQRKNVRAILLEQFEKAAMEAQADYRVELIQEQGIYGDETDPIITKSKAITQKILERGWANNYDFVLALANTLAPYLTELGEPKKD